MDLPITEAHLPGLRVTLGRLKKASRATLAEPLYVCRELRTVDGEHVLIGGTADTEVYEQLFQGVEVADFSSAARGQRSAVVVAVVDDLTAGTPDAGKVNPPPVLVRCAAVVDVDTRHRELSVLGLQAEAPQDVARMLQVLADDGFFADVRVAMALGEDRGGDGPTEVSVRTTEPRMWVEAFGFARDRLEPRRFLMTQEALHTITRVAHEPVFEDHEEALLDSAMVDMELMEEAGHRFAVLAVAPWVWCGNDESRRSLGQKPGTASTCFNKGYRMALLKNRRGQQPGQRQSR